MNWCNIPSPCTEALFTLDLWVKSIRVTDSWECQKSHVIFTDIFLLSSKDTLLMVTKLQLNIVFLTLCDSREVSSSCHINFTCFNPGLPLKSKADQLYTNQHLGGSFLIQDHHRWVVFDLASGLPLLHSLFSLHLDPKASKIATTGFVCLCKPWIR